MEGLAAGEEKSFHQHGAWPLKQASQGSGHGSKFCEPQESTKRLRSAFRHVLCFLGVSQSDGL